MSGRGSFSSDLPAPAIQAVWPVCWEGTIGVPPMRLFQETLGASVLLAQKRVMADVQSSMNMALLALERSSARGCIRNYERYLFAF